MVKFVFKFVLIAAPAILVTSAILWYGGNQIPLVKQVVDAMEAITGRHLAFVDYFKSSVQLYLVGILMELAKSISKLFD